MKTSIGMIKTSQQQLLDQDSPKRTHCPHQPGFGPTSRASSGSGTGPRIPSTGRLLSGRAQRRLEGREQGGLRGPAVSAAQLPSSPLSNLYQAF